MGKFHIFDIDVAEEYGINAAVLLYNIGHWIDKNKVNGKHFHDGKYWTYNSASGFVQLFPYMTERSVRYALQKLIDGGLIVTGNYNLASYDKTMWYALTEKGRCIYENRNSDVTKTENASDNFVTPIPDNKPNNKPDKNNNTLSKDKVCSADAQRVVDAWNALPSVPKVARLMPTANRYKMLMARIRDYGVDNVLDAIANVGKSPFLLGDNRKGWQITFDWFVRPNNFPKVLDGNYVDSCKAEQSDVDTPKWKMKTAEIDKRGATF